VALRKGKEAIVRLFLERDDIDPNIETMAKHPLWWAARMGDRVVGDLNRPYNTELQSICQACQALPSLSF
jgi:hypothetical protein